MAQIIHPKITVKVYNKIFSLTNHSPSSGMDKALVTLIENYEKLLDGEKTR